MSSGDNKDKDKNLAEIFAWIDGLAEHDIENPWLTQMYDDDPIPQPEQVALDEFGFAFQYTFQEEEHPRGWHGRWSDKPGEGKSEKLPSPGKMQGVAKRVTTGIQLRSVEQQYGIQNPNGLDTFQRYTTKEGKFSPQREALHKEILATYANVPPAEGQPTFVVLGGGPASGKSTIVTTGSVALPETKVDINPDLIKDQLADYGLLVKAKDSNAGTYAHEESSYLSKKLMTQTFAKKQNAVLDGTGDGTYEGLKKKVDQAHAAGYKVVAQYVTTDLEEAQRRNVIRAQKSGRLVPDVFMRQTHRDVSVIFAQALESGLFDEVHLWDTNTPGEVKPVLSQVDGKTTIHDQALWGRFLDKRHG